MLPCHLPFALSAGRRGGLPCPRSCAALRRQLLQHTTHLTHTHRSTPHTHIFLYTDQAVCVPAAHLSLHLAPACATKRLPLFVPLPCLPPFLFAFVPPRCFPSWLPARLSANIAPHGMLLLVQQACCSLPVRRCLPLFPSLLALTFPLSCACRPFARGCCLECSVDVRGPTHTHTHTHHDKATRVTARLLPTRLAACIVSPCLHITPLQPYPYRPITLSSFFAFLAFSPPARALLTPAGHPSQISFWPGSTCKFSNQRLLFVMNTAAVRKGVREGRAPQAVRVG